MRPNHIETRMAVEEYRHDIVSTPLVRGYEQGRPQIRRANTLYYDLLSFPSRTQSKPYSAATRQWLENEFKKTPMQLFTIGNIAKQIAGTLSLEKEIGPALDRILLENTKEVKY